MLPKNIIIIFVIFALAFAAFAVDAPRYINRGISAFNANFPLGLPHIPELPFLLGLDLQGGTHLVYEADLSGVEGADAADLMAGLRDVIERRVNYFGVAEPLVQTQEAQGRWRLVVELAGIKDINQAINMIGKTPRLEFKEVRPKEETQEILDKQKEIAEKNPATQEELEQIDGWQLIQEDPYFKPTELGGQYLKKAQVQFDQTTYQPLISLEFNKDGADIFEEITARNVKRPLAIFIDGKAPVDTDGDGEITDRDLYAPIIQEKISGGQAQITGKFSVEEAKELARNLSAGALPVPLGRFDPETGEFKSGEPVSQQTVGPILGEISLQQSLRAGLVGFAMVIIFMVVFYRVPGVLAVLALGIYLAVLLAVFKLIPVTLTLAGIGGVILSVGMAVDANILIFSRMREELSAGKNFAQSVAEGFHRAWPSIRDGNLTTLLVALILFYFGTSFVKGFALTLSIGIVFSMFSAMFVTRHLLRLFERTRMEKVQWLWK